MRPAIALAAAGLCLACAAAAFGADETRPRIASTSLCGDLWALSLADRDQILSLSDFATGPYSARPGQYWPCDHPVVVKAIETLAAARPEFAQPERVRPELAKKTR